MLELIHAHRFSSKTFGRGFVGVICHCKETFTCRIEEGYDPAFLQHSQHLTEIVENKQKTNKA